ncbi:DUF1054 domain-containing protein [Neobacillus notoginsengisoli]|uniref:UPF0637 protein D1B31_17730 n=1 Tax=Neobacillus notoginsengisoli TaxID=1578198 RepID=A0A417YR75_9BACI|nr:DUF1054 domain-containing protein [Neobacillus notoginsengisoli]RHW36555.1 DUF1054 domain-containing protein [Neobacillus notoginsengisoli]
MEFNGFTEDDFLVFTIDGLEKRMEALIQTVRPKLDFLGSHFAPRLSELTEEEMFAHVAKHARRTKNPPNDTWVAFASNPRGYKMLPHFQIGLWETHLFIWFAVIYECNGKPQIGETFLNQLNQIHQAIPASYVWSEDHMKPGATFHGSLSKDELGTSFQRLKDVKKAEILCGCHIDRDIVIQMGPSELLRSIDDVFRKILPLYKLS